MQTPDENSETCPFAFNFYETSFKVGDTVSYRVPETLGDFPFVGTIVAVFEDHIVIMSGDPTQESGRMRATRESRPVVSAAELT